MVTTPVIPIALYVATSRYRTCTYIVSSPGLHPSASIHAAASVGLLACSAPPRLELMVRFRAAAGVEGRGGRAPVEPTATDSSVRVGGAWDVAERAERCALLPRAAGVELSTDSARK